MNVYNSVANYLNDDRTRQSYYATGATAVGVDNVAEGDRSTAIGNKAKVLNSVGSYYVDAYGRLTRDQDDAYYYLDEQGRITTTPQYVKDNNGQYVRDTNGNYIKTSFLTVDRLIDSTDAVAVGSDVTAEGRSAVAIGHQSYAKEYSVAIGENSVTDYMGVAIGKDNKAKYASTAIGHTNDANGYYTATMGVNNTAHGDYSSAIGYQNTVDAIQTGSSERKANQSHALGSYNTIKGDYNLAAGDNNSIDKISGMAVGVGNKISMDHNPENSTPINLDNQSGDYSIAVGLGNKSEKNALVIGKYSSALHDGSIAIGNSVNAQSNNNNSATDSIAIGTGSQAMTKDSIALGHEAQIGNNNSQELNGAIAIGKGADAENGQSLAIGYEAYTGNNQDVATKQNGSIIAIGTNAQAMAGYDIAIGAKASTASTKSSNSGGSAVAIGYNAVINDGAQRSVATGANASVALNVQDAVALGSQSYAERTANNQGGYDPASNSKNHNAGSDPVWNSTLAAVSVGSSDHYVWDGTKNIHYAQQTRQITNVAAGKEDTDAVNVAQLKQVVSLVNNSGGSSTGGSGVHDYNVNSVDSANDTNYNNTGATGNNALAAGVSASAKGENAVAIGTGAKADGVGATVIGQYGTATGRYALAFGGQQTDTSAAAANNVASGDNSVAFGERTTASSSNSTAFGQGTKATEKRATAFGQRTQATQSNATAFGIDTIASGQNATAFGNLTQATAIGATAFGNKNQATGQYATAWGGGDKVVDNGDGTTTKVGTVASGTYATAFGERTVASGESATAFGSDSTASGKNSLAFGENSTAAGDNSLAALGGQVTTSATNAAAIGKNAQATLADSVALGSNSVTTRAKYSDLTDEEKKAVYIKGDSTGSAWEATDNAIAVGNDSRVTRQITGVAAGSLDTDAVNVAQLKKVQNLASKHTKVTVEGGTAAGTADYAGENLKLKVTDDNGQKTYDLKLSDKLSIGGKDGQDGHIGVNGQDGKSGIGIDGKDGISIKGKDGNDGVTIKGIDGVDGVDGAEGHIGLNGKDGMTDIWTKPGTPGLNGKDGETMTRIVYQGKDGKEHQGATLDDGLKFGGDFGTASAVKLNKQVNVKGNAKTGADLTDGNIGVVSSQDGENGQLLVKLNKDLDLTDKGSVKMGNTTIDNGGVTIKNSAADTTKNVSLTNAGLDNGGNKITNVAAGEISDTSTDAVNGSQLNTVKTLAGKHTKVTVEGGTAAGTADYAGENLKLKVTDDNGQKTYDLKLSDKLSIGGKDGQDGHIGVNGQDGKSGVGIDGKDGISIKGKDGNDGVTIKGIDGVDGVDGAEGHIGLNGKDGMTDIWTKPGTPGLNGKDGETMTRIVYKDPSGQEHEAATLDDGLKFGGDFGNASAVKLDKQVNVKGNAKKETDLTDGNIGVVSSQDGENGQLLVKLNKDLNLGNNGSVKIGNTTINNAGVTIQPSAGDATKSVSLTNKGLDNGGNKITNVADGEISATSKDAVNGSQLNTVKNLAEQHTTVEAGPSGNVTVTPGTNADGSKKYTVDLAKDVTFGDAAKGDKTVAISGINGTITAGTGDNKVTVDGSKGQIVAGGDNGVKIGKIANGDISLTIYDKDGKATDKKADGGKFVTNLDNKTWNTDGSYVSGRAATEDQLHQVESNVNKKFDDVNTKIESVDKHHTEVTVNGGTAAKADGSYTDGNLQIAQKTGSDGQKIYDLKLSDNLNIGGVGKDGKDSKDGHMGINGADGKSGVGIDGKDGISIKGKDGQNGVTIKGVDGKDGTEGHIGLTGPKGADGQNATADIHVKNGQNGVDGTDGHGGKDGMDRVVYEDHNHITHEVATMDDGMKYSGDSGNAAVKLNKNVQIYGGATEYADGNNIGVVASQDGDNAKLQVKLAKDLKGINSIEAKTITTGNTTINNGGLTIKTSDDSRTITVQDGNVNMGGNTISGVADGKVSKDSTDAVNGSQLWQRDQAINGLSGSVNKLGNRINRVGAGAAALAALHPLDFDPDDKWDFAAGYGNYRGANAAAIGAYYRPNEDTMFSVGGSFGGGENMVNAGVSIKLGQGNHVSTSRVAMAKEMKAMRQHMAEQDALIAKLQSMHGMAVDPTKSTLFPDVAENHWAYQYVTTLAKKGILEGYPDGEFKGDRMMTRYEFAAIVYRIVESGVGSTDPELSKLVKEFSPELQYIRIDTIQKDRNGKPTIERVRVISDAK
ncbi:S-layer homology domain-containing protein [Megasphaera sp.]|uniref:S-layer homology domain-containing protein n=1 Tax=Megasphaera sp. TaxID=2023260 RepID=UPI0035221D57